MPEPTQIVQISLNDSRVTRGFREAVFQAAARSGVSVNEYVLTAAGEKLRQLGRDFPGVFENERRVMSKSTACRPLASNIKGSN